MANCTISTMAVNDCHLQFSDSLGNLIYEFDLETIIALNNGNGILIKDELTTLTIDKTIVVDNLEMTIAELITYIQEQRVLCTCACVPQSETIVATTWGFDSGGTKPLVYVKQMSDGSVQYESPIGTSHTLVGVIEPVITQFVNSNFNILEASGIGAIPSCIEWNIENVGGAAGDIDGVTLLHQHESKGQKSFFYNPTGTYYLTDTINYDSSATTFLITYTTT